ncbi:MAG: GNAT family N-acetyltransferase [Oscillospiraceae bacterium]|nr:GNAT family N-acetyltransferase [Oscillospiraceae bacterium]
MVRRYDPRDLQGCGAVFCSAFAAEPWNENWTQQLAETRISELTGTPISAGFVYDEQGSILAVAAGRVCTYLYGKEYVIDEFCVSAEMQGKGIGSRLMQRIEQEMRAAGCVGIVLQTTRGYPSERFYLKNGFQRNPDMITMYRLLNEKTEFS